MKVTGNADKSFLTTGFTNWKDATAKFTKHETSDFHKMCVEALSPADVGDQPGYRTYRNMQDLITKACRGEPYYEDELEYACDFYGDDLPRIQLQTQLPLLRHLF